MFVSCWCLSILSGRGVHRVYIINIWDLSGCMYHNLTFPSLLLSLQSCLGWQGCRWLGDLAEMDVKTCIKVKIILLHFIPVNIVGSKSNGKQNDKTATLLHSHNTTGILFSLAKWQIVCVFHWCVLVKSFKQQPQSSAIALWDLNLAGEVWWI